MKYLVVALSLCLLVLRSFGIEVYSENKIEQENDLGLIKYQCSFYENFSIFSYKIVENRINDEDFNSTIIEDPNKALYFSFCNDSNITCSNLDNQERGAVLIRDNSAAGNNKCIRVASDNWNDVDVKYIDNELDRNKDYLRLSWEGPDECEFDTSQNWSFSIDVVCSDVKIEDSRFFYTGGYDSSCHVTAQAESKLGCSIVSYQQISEFLNANRVIFAIVLIVVGLFLCIAGYRIILVTLFLSAVFATIAIVGVIAFRFFVTKETKHYILWIILGASILVGCIIGYLLVRFRRVGIFILAVWGGICIGFIINNAVTRYLQSSALFWVVIAACGLACGIISCFVYIIASIGSTALVGSYAVVRGISVFIGYFPSEITIIEQIKNGTVPKTQWQFWVYLAGIAVLFIASFIVQWKTRPERNNKKNKAKKNGEYYRQI